MKKTLMGAVLVAATMFGAGAVMAQDAKPTLKFCTGAKGGNYDFTGQVLQSELSGAIDVVLVPTAGSYENLQKIAAGDCDAGISQSDAIYLYNKEFANALNVYTLDSLYSEYFHLLCNRHSGVENFSDLNSKTIVFSGGRGSGADVTLRGLIRADIEEGGGDYKDVPIRNEGGAAALVKLNGGQAACMAYTGAPGSQIMRDAEKFAENLVLVPVQDKDFNDVTFTDKNGQSLSVWDESFEIPDDAYGNILPSGNVYGHKAVPTVGVQAIVVLGSAWAEANPDAFGTLGLALPDVKNIVRSKKGLK